MIQGPKSRASFTPSACIVRLRMEKWPAEVYRSCRVSAYSSSSAPSTYLWRMSFHWRCRGRQYPSAVLLVRSVVVSGELTPLFQWSQRLSIPRLNPLLPQLALDPRPRAPRQLPFIRARFNIHLPHEAGAEDDRQHRRVLPEHRARNPRQLARPFPSPSHLLSAINCSGNRSRVDGVRNRLEIRALASQSPLPNSLPLPHSATQPPRDIRCKLTMVTVSPNWDFSDWRIGSTFRSRRRRVGFAGFRLARSLVAVSDEVLRASLFPEPRYWREAEVAGGRGLRAP